MKFEECVRIILQHEGGARITRDPSDPGGLSRYGISQRAYPTLDIEKLTEAQAMALYHQDYWAKVKCDELPAYMRLTVFDCAVNQGVQRAILFMQRATNVTVDGVIGPKTIYACNKIDPSLFMYGFSNRRLEAYQSHPMWARFGQGWVKRLMDITLKCFAFLVKRAGAH